MQQVSEPRPTRAARLLGVFILFQIVYLPLANFMQLVPRELPAETGEFDVRVQREGRFTRIDALQSVADGLGTLLDRYGELSGQVQAWSLFAPDVAIQSVFPMVECMSVEDGIIHRAILPPRPIPSKYDEYFRWPDSLSRLRSYDYLLAVIYARYSEQSLRDRGDEWRAAIRDRVRQQQRSLAAFFQASLKQYLETRPGTRPPQEMVLSVRIIPAPAPGQRERPPAVVLPLARWELGRTDDPQYLPIEAYDPIDKKFVRLPRNEGKP